MVLFGAIRRGLDDREALATFIDEEAEAFARSAVDGYTRARARHDAEELFAQAAFAAVLAKARAEAYPIALALAAEAVESALAPQAHDRAAQLHGLIAVAQAAFDRRPAPAPVTPIAWQTARAVVVRTLGEVMLHPPRTTNAIVEPHVGSMLALMPINDRLGRDDYPLLRDAMRSTLAAIHERFMTAVKAPALAAALVEKA